MQKQGYPGTDQSLGVVAVFRDAEGEWVVGCGDCQQMLIRTIDKGEADQARRDHHCGTAA